MGAYSELSIFIDESGDCGSNSDFYLLTFVFHDQAHPIDKQLRRLSLSLTEAGWPHAKALHTGPMVRREDEYQNMGLQDRRRLFARLLGFARRCDISYKTFCISKREYPDTMKLKARLSREVSVFFLENMEYFIGFDRVVAYYDNGQAMVTNIINSVFGAVFFDVDFRRVFPSDYRLFQCADLFCTLELLREKKSRGVPFSKSEQIFFGNWQTLKKDYLKKIEPLGFPGRT
ncbi:MAG: DUF3800 domain-containing protein [Eggerthellaceae bacterium]|nr:DUF3800 domain-containing protein [Eggerthellaceae bacterium]